MHEALSTKLRDALILLAFAALSVAMTWPLATHLGTHVVQVKWHYDSMVNIHILGSRLHYMLGWSEALRSVYDNYFCAPTPYSITNNEAHFGLVLLYAPFFLFTKNPLLAYNLLLLTCFTLAGFFTYRLVRELAKSHLAGVLSGIAFAFCPYVFFELGRIQLVAMQWLPLFALFLHRAAGSGEQGELGRTRAFVGLALTFAMQIGCCLYYAMFMIVYALCVGTVLVVQRRLWGRALVLRLVLAGVIAGALVAPQVYPYFRARADYSQVRSQELSQRYSGTLADLAKVAKGNRTLTHLHDPATGPEEPIGFPGYVLLFLAALAVVGPTLRTIQGASERRELWLGVLVLAALVPLAAVATTFMARTFLAGVLVFVAGLAWWRKRGTSFLPPLTRTYLLMFLLGVSLYLGPTPFQEDGGPVRGTYYYLYKYAPGFDGIRYVSRFAALNMLVLAVLGGFGATLLLRGTRGAARVVTFVVLLGAMLLELRNAPVTLAGLPVLEELPAYRWLAKRKGPEPIATIPAYTMGYYGALNDYLALFHRRRTIDGKSSWMPPITYTHIYESRRFPRESGLRLLQTLGAKYLVIRAQELRGRAPRILHWLDARPGSVVKRFVGGDTHIYELLPQKDPSLTLLSTPALPEGSVRVPSTELRASADSANENVELSIDGDVTTQWETQRDQFPGNYYQLDFAQPRVVTAIELGGYDDAFAAPAAFQLVTTDAAGTRTLQVHRPVLRYYYDQVYHPKKFVMRLVLPKPRPTKTLRIQLVDGVAGRPWVVREATVWAKP